MYQQRQSNTAVANNATGSGDTTYTKIFVGGLAWETQRETLKRYFEQFGEILEAAVIVDKNTGRSKGYGFVTFKDPDSARRACRYQYPVIDGRRANCNLAAFGARNNYPTTPSRGMEKFRPSLRTMAPVPFQGPPTYFHPHMPQHTFPYSAYGYPYYLQDMYSMSVYNAYGGQHLPSYSNGFIASGSHEVYDCYSYAQHGDGSAIHNPKIIQNPYLYQQQYRPLGGLQVPTSASPSNTSTENPVTAPIAEAGVPRTGSEQSSSA